MSRTTTIDVTIRSARENDLSAIRRVYNEGIEDRIATLDEHLKSEGEIEDWWREHGECYTVLVAEQNGAIAGWASLNRFSHRCAHAAIADLSIYVERQSQGRGIGTMLLQKLVHVARANGFRKIVLHALAANEPGKALYQKCGFRDVGIFQDHGRIDGRYVDVIAMERVLKPLILFVCKHNTGRTQMAEAYLRHFVGDTVEVHSAGTIPADAPEPNVVAAMLEDGIDLSHVRPKLLDSDVVRRADRIITMGCDVEGVQRIDDDWGLPDPKGQALERVREIRDLVKQKARSLTADLEALG